MSEDVHDEEELLFSRVKTDDENIDNGMVEAEGSCHNHNLTCSVSRDKKQALAREKEMDKLL